MLASVRGEATSAKTTCSSSRTRNDPFADTLGFPLESAVATYAGWISPMAFLASSLNLIMSVSFLEIRNKAKVV